MDYKTLLVHYDAGRTAPARLELALQLAARTEAHVTCLYALDLVPPPSYAAEAGQALADAARRAQAEALAQAKAGYDECVARSGYHKVEWRQSGEDALEVVAREARTADLVVIGQKYPEWPSGVGRGFERKLPLTVPRPVLVVPYAFERRPIGENVCIAWNGGREAARAVSDALPLLKRAKRVQALVFNGTGERGAELVAYLARHGVQAGVGRYEIPGGGSDIGNLLLSRAFDLGADLIVMGAWGHSRMHEMVLGGVTRTLLETMTVPVLMSH